MDAGRGASSLSKALAPTITTGVDSDHIEGVGKLDDRLLILLDLSRLFDTEQLKGFGEMADASA